MARLFGTDGVRGVANQDLTADLALHLSVAAAHILGEAGVFGRRQPTALVARDPRVSGEFLEAAVCAGLASAGVDVMRVGVAPTPAAAFLVNEYRTDLGVMISASHNDMPDNGIKFFARGGVKLDDGLEDAIEERVEELREERLKEIWQRPIGDKVGRIVDQPSALDSYVKHLVRSLRAEEPLKGLTVVLDCANGASSETAVDAFEAAGASVTAIHASPDGLNINAGCGSTHPRDLQKAVVASSADLGLAFDGDADRCLAVDHEGNLVDGDQILAILALALQEDHRLASNTVVATVMSNLGLKLAMAEHDIRVDQTKVGDRYVLESMGANGFSLGGEQSGHVIMSEFATTGDGVLTGLHLAKRIATTKKTLKELASVMTRLPQVVINVRGVDKLRAGVDPTINSAVSDASHELGKTGRVLLRPSGTEPVVRVMVEAPTDSQAREVAERLADLVKRQVGL